MLDIEIKIENREAQRTTANCSTFGTKIMPVQHWKRYLLRGMEEKQLKNQTKFLFMYNYI